jgi:hypothetical protein
MLLIAFRELTNLGDIYDPVWMISAYQKSTAGFRACYVIGMLIGILTVLLTLALQERMQAKAPTQMSPYWRNTNHIKSTRLRIQSSGSHV